jgi:integrase
LADITPWLIEKYKKERKEKGKSPQTINLELACLKTMFSKAVIWGKATANPVKQVKLFHVNNARVRFLNEEEETRLLAECPAHLRDLVISALHTGFRRNELLTLQVSDVDFARGLVRVQAGYAKNGEGRFVSLTDTVRDVLRRLVKEAEVRGGTYLFWNKNGLCPDWV